MKNYKSIFLFILSCAFSANLIAQPSVNKKGNETVSGYKVGDTAEDFTLMNTDGSMFSLSDIKDAKGYIVIFTSNVCPFAVLYEDRMIALHQKMNAQGYPVIAINSNDQDGDSFEDMKVRAQEKNFPFVYLNDENQTIYPQFGATKTPHVYLLDKNLVVQYIGAIDDNAKAPESVEQKYVEMAVAELNAGSLPNPNFTKAIGCPIKSKGQNGRGNRKGSPSIAELFERMDSNNDNKISKTEAHGPLSENFEELDKDNDGQLTEAELKEMKPPKRRPHQSKFY